MKHVARWCLATALTAASFQVLALGLGAIVVKSRVDEPLLAEIPVTGAAPGEAEGLKASLASAEEVERAGIETIRGGAQVQLEVAKTKDDRTVIRVTTRSAVHEPFLSFLVNVSWSSGRLLREYKVALPSGTATASSSGVATESAAEPERSSAEALPPAAAPKAAPARAQRAQAPAPASAAKAVPAPTVTPPPPAPKPAPAKPAAPAPAAVAAAPKPAPAAAAPPATRPAPAKTALPEPAAVASTATPPTAAAAKAPPPAPTPPPPAKTAAPAPGAQAGDERSELERAKANLASKERESSALRARVTELEKAQPANRQQIERENAQIDQVQVQLAELSRKVREQEEALARAQAAPTAPAAAATRPGAAADSSGVAQGADRGAATPAPAPPADRGAAPSPPPVAERSWLDDWMLPAGGLVLILAGAFVLMRMRRSQLAPAPEWSASGAVTGAPVAPDEFKASDAGDFAALDADALDEGAAAPAMTPADSIPRAEIPTAEFEAPPLGQAAPPSDEALALHDVLFEPEVHAAETEPSLEVESRLATPAPSPAPPLPEPEVEPAPAYIPAPMPAAELPQAPPPQVPPPAPMPDLPHPAPAPAVAAAPDDAVGTKLELASAYLEMGDPDAARDMLREVLEEGTASQRDTARQLLAEIDPNKK